MPHARKRSLLWVLLSLAPVCAYATIMVLSVFREGHLNFGRVDLGVLVLVLSYVCAVILAAAWRNGRYWARYLLATYMSLLALVGLEFAVRSTLPPAPPGVPSPPMRSVSVVGDRMPGIDGTVEFSVNSIGLRGPEVDLDDVELRILCVGGSSTESLYVTDKSSWPWVLQDELSARLGKSVFVGSAGRRGHFTLHHEYLLENYTLAAKFDWVIVLAGFNDLAVLTNRAHYERLKWNVPDETLTFSSKERASYRALAIVRLLETAARTNLGAETMQDPEGEWVARARERRQAALKSRTIREVPADLDQALATYAANLKRLISLTTARRQNLLLVTQPTMYRKDLPEPLEQLLWAHSVDGAYSTDVLEEMMNRFNQTMLDVCAEEATVCLDLASMLPKDTSTFYDDEHFNLSGSQKIAAILTDFIAANLATDAAAESPVSSAQ